MSRETIGMADHPAKQEMEKMWRDGMRAKAILKHLDENDLPLVEYKTLAKYGERNWSEELEVKLENKDLNFLKEFVDELNEQKIGTVQKIAISKKNYPGWDKTEDGESIPAEKESTSSVVTIVPNSDLPELERAVIPDIKISSKASKKHSKPFGMSLAVSLPDMQIGALERRTGALEPTQDERALNIAHQILLYEEEKHGIDLIVNQGDNLDFPMFSTHLSGPGYVTQRATQYTIDRAGTEARIQRTIAKNAEIVWLQGNHDARFLKMQIEKIPAMVGLTRSNEEIPVNSIPYLLRFEENNIQYIDSYPDGEYWAAPNLRFEHGHKISSVPGSTARKYLREGISTVYGHHHHSEILYLTSSLQGRAVTSFAGSAGCLARLDGFLPSTKTGLNSKGEQNAQHPEAWQQGIWLIWYDPIGQKEPILNPVRIFDGKAIHDGIEFVAQVDKYGEQCR